MEASEPYKITVQLPPPASAVEVTVTAKWPVAQLKEAVSNATGRDFQDFAFTFGSAVLSDDQSLLEQWGIA